MTQFQELVGESLLGLELGHSPEHDGYEWLLITTNRKLLTYVTDSDCCSETFIYAIQGVHSLVKHHDVNIMEVIECPVAEDNGTRQEYDKVYRYTLVTNHGYVDIEFRNSSNGYYGGSLIDCGGGPYGMAPPSDIVWQPITQDYFCDEAKHQ